MYRDGLPVFSVPLPSRRHNCEFTLKPVTHTVGKFISYMKEEDGGIDRAAIFTDGRYLHPSPEILIEKSYSLCSSYENERIWFC